MPAYTVDIFSFVAGILFGLVLFMACVGILRSVGS
jgi:hypothetical protein